MSIRFAREEDLPRILAIYSQYVENTTWSFEYEPPSLEEFTGRFRDITAQFPWLVWEEAGTVLGYAYGSAPFSRAAYRWCTEDSVYLAPEALHKGIGKKLCLALEAVLRLQGYRKIYAIITSENTNSLAFHKAIGYRHLADFPGCGFKHGKLLGITWMEKDLNTAGRQDTFPKPWHSVVDNDGKLSEFLDKIPLS